MLYTVAYYLAGYWYLSGLLAETSLKCMHSCNADVVSVMCKKKKKLNQSLAHLLTE